MPCKGEFRELERVDIQGLTFFARKNIADNIADFKFWTNFRSSIIQLKNESRSHWLRREDLLDRLRHSPTALGSCTPSSGRRFPISITCGNCVGFNLALPDVPETKDEEEQAGKGEEPFAPTASPKCSCGRTHERRDVRHQLWQLVLDVRPFGEISPAQHFVRALARQTRIAGHLMRRPC